LIVKRPAADSLQQAGSGKSRLKYKSWARMYVYDAFDRTLVAERVAEFRDQVARRLSGELSEEEFKPLRLMNGVYLQLHAYMLRIAIPYGTLSSAQLRMLAHVARKYDRGYGHFTTRQNIQYHWIKLAELPDAMADLASVGMHGMQTSGNVVRNITTDQWAGAAPDEIEDPRIWAELIRQHVTLHPEFSFMPRKFKIAVGTTRHDRAALRIHDLGLQLHRNEAGETGFEVMVGGGLGRTPFLAKTIKPFLEKRDVLSYVEAILRTYNQFGRRDNIYKARIKILVHELGPEVFAKEVDAEWQSIKDGTLALDDDIVTAITGRFSYPVYERLADSPPELNDARRTDRSFDAWMGNSVANHKVAGYAIVTLSLKPEGGTPGDATAAQMDAVADLADRYSFGEIRVGHEQNLVLPHVAQRDLPVLWRALEANGVAVPNVNLVSDIISCPGLDYCSLANARSIPIAQEITRRFHNLDLQRDLGRLHVNISGCINACGHHHVGHIGILGVEKNGEEFYQITLGGKADENATLGTLIGPAVPYAQVADVVEDIAAAYLELRQRPDELFIDTVKRTGVEPFRERVYATR
jgi:sulfite reductase (NADPH) hemoprotein beta-component